MCAVSFTGSPSGAIPVNDHVPATRAKSPASRTRVTFRFAYGVAGGGISGLIAERVAARSLSRRFSESLRNVRRAVEQRESAAVGQL